MNTRVLDQLDIERLHKIIEKGVDSPFPRQHGKTTAIIALMLGEAELGDVGNRYLYVTNTAGMAKYAMNRFCDILNQENFLFSVFGPDMIVRVFDKIRIDHTKQFVFRPLAEGLLRGSIFDNLFVDVYHPTLSPSQRRALEEVCAMQKMREA